MTGRALPRLVVLISAAIGLGVLGWNVANPRAGSSPVIPASVVILPNGMPYDAALGSTDRALIDWLANSGSGEYPVDLGNAQFQPRAAIPRTRFRERIAKLTTVLIAFENVEIHLAADPRMGASEIMLAAERIQWLTQ